MSAQLRIGTAGWSLPPGEQGNFPGEGTHLERYARVFNAVEINSTFRRSHRESTYERWAQSVPRGFRFSVKLTRAITHDARLAGPRAALRRFAAEIAPLKSRLGCVLVQLPPSLELAPRQVRAFFAALRDSMDAPAVVEPRHASWFTAEADALLDRLEVARVAADPPRAPGGDVPGGWRGLAYYRLHGFPRVYYSSYSEDFLATLAAGVAARRRARIPCWCIFDNTTLGAATGNALVLKQIGIRK